MGYLIFFGCYRLSFLIGLRPMLVYVIPSGLFYFRASLFKGLHPMLIYVIPSGLRYFRASLFKGLHPMFAYVIPSGLRYFLEILLSHEVATYISDAATPIALIIIN